MPPSNSSDTFDGNDVYDIYTRRLPSRYDSMLLSLHDRWKRRAINQSSLKDGDKVVIFCCGTGADFQPVLERIGSTGKIVGVDFSANMLAIARQKVQQNEWNNIELIEANVTQFKHPLQGTFDAGICTLGLSIIPEYRSAYDNLRSCVRTNGEIIIGDMRLVSGWRAHFNPLTIWLSKSFGGTYQGHENSTQILSLMENELKNPRKGEFFIGSYFYCVGTVR